MNSKNWTVNPLLNWFGSSNLPWPTIWVGSEVVKRGGTKQKESCLTNLKKYNIIYIENEKKDKKKNDLNHLGIFILILIIVIVVKIKMGVAVVNF